MSLTKLSGRRRDLRLIKDSPNFTNVNKKLNFGNLDDEEPSSVRDIGDEGPQFDMDLDHLDDMMLEGVHGSIQLSDFESFSPCRTRSGCVYESGLKKRKFRNYKKKAKRSSTVRARIFSGNSGTGSIGDCSENGSDGSGDDNVNLGN